MELKVEFIRGDYYEYPFRITDNEGGIIKLTAEDNLIFSAKTRYISTEYVIQKRLGEGIEWDEENECYSVIFEHKDTADLKSGLYKFDIVVVYEGNKPLTYLGDLVLLPDVTRNELEGN